MRHSAQINYGMWSYLGRHACFFHDAMHVFSRHNGPLNRAWSWTGKSCDSSHGGTTEEGNCHYLLRCPTVRSGNCAGNAGNVFPRRRFQRIPLVSDPGMHHGTCVTHVPWCMSGSLACSERGKRSRHSRRMRTRNFAYLARGSCMFLQLWYDNFVPHHQPKIAFGDGTWTG